MKQATVLVEGDTVVIEVDDDMPRRMIIQEAKRLHAAQVRQERKTGPGPFGVVSPEIRKSVREFVERRSFPVRAAIEGAPATVGGIFGFGAGLTTTGGAASLPLAAVGATSGELIAQEFGLSEGEIPTAVAAGVFELAGPVAGKTLKTFNRQIIGRFPGVGTAAEKLLTSGGVSKVRNLVDKLRIGKGGVSRLYKEAEELGGNFNPEDFQSSVQEIDGLLKQANDAGEGFGLGNLKTILGNFKKLLKGEGPGGGPRFAEGAGLPQIFAPEAVKKVPITFTKLITRLTFLNAEIKTLAKAGGTELGSLKRLKSVVLDDMERIIESDVLEGASLQASKRAVVAARKEFAVESLGEAIEDGIASVKGEGGNLQLNPEAILNKIRSLTTKADKDFDGNFVKGLKNDLPEILEFLEDANSITTAKGLQAGSLVIASKFSRLGQSAVGGLAAFFGMPQNIVLQTAGALVGVNIPNMIGELLITPTGRKILLRLMQAGKGKLNVKQLAMWSQLLGQSGLALGRESERKFLELRGQSSSQVKPKTAPLSMLGQENIEKQTKSAMKDVNVSLEDKVRFAIGSIPIRDGSSIRDIGSRIFATP